MINPDIKSKWVAALRSGKYKQGQGKLRVNDRYCCLGVLCDIVNPEGWEQIPDPDNKVYANRYRGSCNAHYIPHDLEKDAGLGNSINVLRLAPLNDSGYSFDQIADYIEKHL